ncbi:MAG: glutamate mutase L [Bacillota bacterium]
MELFSEPQVGEGPSIPDLTRWIIAVDVGSTTTKGACFERRDQGLVLRAVEHAPTTVEKPFEDVTIGLDEAIRRLGEAVGERFAAGGTPGPGGTPGGGRPDVALVATSSAGGGLQMLACGTTQRFSASSAHRAAMGAGAIVLATLSPDDGLSLAQKADLVRDLRPDMILMGGGFDGGQVSSFIAELADLLRTARPRPRLGDRFRIPLVYAGNDEGHELVEDVLGEQFIIHRVANLAPGPRKENPGPAREAIHRLFQEHVMSRAPGYGKLLARVAAPVLPTPGAVAKAVELAAKAWGRDVLAFDIGGATTDVFSVRHGRLARSVSANLGMSYSALNVLQCAGLDRLLRWMPGEDGTAVAAAVANKTLHPTTLPETAFELRVEQAVAREALRLALQDHVEVAGGGLSEGPGTPLVIGSGGVLSFAPSQEQVVDILADAVGANRPVEVAVDDRFLLPQVGALSATDPNLAVEVLERHSVKRLTTVDPRRDRQ